MRRFMRRWYDVGVSVRKERNYEHTRKKAMTKPRMVSAARPPNIPPAMGPAATAEALSGASEAAMVDAAASSVKVGEGT